MTQEIKVNLTLSIEAEVSCAREDIVSFIDELMTKVTSTKYFSLQAYQLNRIEEEAEIYAPDIQVKNGVWDFIEKYYPNYYSCQEIMRNDELCKIVNVELNGEAVDLFKREFNQDYDLAVIAFDQSTKYIYERAITAYLKDEENTITIRWSVEDVQERAKENGYLLKEGEALKVLTMLKEKYDCTIGVSWDIIDGYLSYIVPDSIEDDGFEWEPLHLYGTEYLCRSIPDFDDQGMRILVAPVCLSAVMKLGSKQNAKSEEALLDEQVSYYGTDEELNLSNQELFKLIYP